jgi:hypothetical protein
MPKAALVTEPRVVHDYGGKTSKLACSKTQLSGWKPSQVLDAVTLDASLGDVRKPEVFQWISHIRCDAASSCPEGIVF